MRVFILLIHSHRIRHLTHHKQRNLEFDHLIFKPFLYFLSPFLVKNKKPVQKFSKHWNVSWVLRQDGEG